MSLFSLVAKLRIDSTDFAAGLKKSESAATATMANIGRTVAAAFSVAAITAFTKSLVDMAGQIRHTADELDITTDQVQKLNRLADASNIPMERYANVLQKIRKAKADFVAGDKTAVDLFGRLGINPGAEAFDILEQLGFTEDKSAVFELIGVKSAEILKSLQTIKDIGPMVLIDEETITRLEDAETRLGRLKIELKSYATTKIADILTNYDKTKGGPGGGVVAALGAILGSGLDYIGDAFGFDGQSKKNMGRLNLPDALAKREDARAALPQVSDMPAGYNPAGRSAEWVGPMQAAARGKFSAIPAGDRSNVGGFFGPNVDINRKMSADIAAMRTRIESIEKVVTGAVVES